MSVTIEHHRLTADGVTLHYAVAGTGTLLILIHGFPQTWQQWVPVIELLATRYRIVAPDLRGIGAGPGPATGYDKHTLASDIRAITLHEFGDQPVVVCGHDMGAFVAFAYALNYRDTVAALLLVDAPPPGTSLWDAGVSSPRAYHVALHAQVDVALMLVTGRERAYIAQFIASRIYDTSAVSPEDIDLYADAYSAPGALRAAFQMYRALLFEDPDLNRSALAKGKLEMPVMMVASASTLPPELMEGALAEVADTYEIATIDRTGHWISQEQPDALSAIIDKHAGKVR